MLRSLRLIGLLFASSLLVVACDDNPPPTDAGTPPSDAGTPDPEPPAELAGVEQTGRFVIPELTGHAHVVRTEYDVPHIYAENRLDAWRVLGFTMARDRFFQMDLT
ncbi:MAG: penicillin acylase family protein, partial [Myxococcales bacterium]|nr:penicillin acylase family protein [Myxococcales bacterium]